MIRKIVAFIAICSACLPSTSKAALEPPEHPLFDGDAVHEIHLTFHQADWWDQLTDNYEYYEDIPYIEAEFDWETIHFDDIGVRFKGNSSYMSYNGLKKSFKLDIDEFTSGQTVYGLDKLNLNNCFLDPSFVREKCAYELCKAVGLPTERTNYAAVYINGTYWGLYLLVEQYDQEFIESRYGPSEEGNLWKGEPHGSLEYVGSSESSYYGDYELKTNEDINDWSSLVELADGLNNTSLVDLPDTLHNLIDVNSAMAMIAIDNFTVNLDSYIGRCVNYYFYHRDLDSRVVFAKWDQNEAFGLFNMYGLSLTQLKQLSPYWTSTQSGEDRPLAERMFQIADYDNLYLGHMQKLMAGVAHPDTLLPRMEELRDLIRSYVYADPNCMFTTSEFENAMSSDQYVSGGPPPGRLIPGLNGFISDRNTYLSALIGTWTPIEGLVLNEVMAVNGATATDEHGDYDDWIEIANTGVSPINLSGFVLTDHWEGSADFVFPDTTLQPGEYIVVWADEEPGEGDLHAAFKLDGDGEDVYLTDGQVLIDQVTFPELASNVTWGRWPNGTGDWQMLSMATIGAENLNPHNPEEVNLFINEFQASNDSVIQDETGTYEDWLEIYNPGPDPVEMLGLFLTDDLTSTTKWSFPDTTLEAGGFLLVWTDNDEEDGPLHTNFKLSADGEEIGLFGRLAAGNEEIDSHVFGVQSTDTSLGRYPDGTGNWIEFPAPTPGSSNQTASNQPPVITNTAHSPGAPSETDSVRVTSTISDDDEVASATLYVDTGSGYYAIPMFDDGSHNDGASGDSTFGATIPPRPPAASVSYYVYAEDDSASSTSDPASAPTISHGYTVNYDPPPIVINEFMASNSSCCTDEFAEYEGWIELYNAGPDSVDLTGMHLTNDAPQPTLWEIPAGISVGAWDHVLFWTDGEEGQGDTHTSFTLDAGGGYIGLYDSDEVGAAVIDMVYYGTQTTDVSWGRVSDGDLIWQAFDPPTPDASNSGNCICGEFTSRLTGNCNCSVDGKLTLSDITILIDNVYISKSPLCCQPNGNTNGSEDCKRTLSDITKLIDAVYISKAPTADCMPECEV